MQAHVYTHTLQASFHMHPTLAFIYMSVFMSERLGNSVESMNESKTILLQREICVISEKHT